MIAVIADDFTGAAEIGGIGLRYGLTTEILYEHVAPTDAALLVIDTNTRSLNNEQAVKRTAKLTADLKALNPQLIYKKVDSALRGYIVNELNVQLEILGLKKALLIPANPVLGRTIVNGQYYLRGEPIHTTSFGTDPEFGITQSTLHHMLRVDDSAIHVRKPAEGLTHQGITIGEIHSVDDLTTWARKVPAQTLLAGGSGFFAALMDARFAQTSVPAAEVSLAKPNLFVSGSTFEKSKKRVEQLVESNGPVSYMPAKLVAAKNPQHQLFDDWANEIVTLLQTKHTAVIAVHEGTTKPGETQPNAIRDKTARVVAAIVDRTEIKELLIEGGSTAAAIVNSLGLNKFTPVNEFSTGVIRMKAAEYTDLLLTLKPGSYDWPPYIWDFE